MVIINIIHLESVDSTNKYLKENSCTLPDKTLVFSDIQTQGRGRMGRTFISNTGGVYMSLLLKTNLDPDFVTIKTAVAVNMAVKEAFNIDTQIKWVNDIYINNKKICGILAESNYNSNTNKFDNIVVGIGLNLVKGNNILPSEIKDRADYLFKSGNFEEKRQIFIDTFLKIFFSLNDKTEIIEKYRAADYLKGKEITFKKGDLFIKGIASGIDNGGKLIIKTKNGIEFLNQGEVTTHF